LLRYGNEHDKPVRYVVNTHWHGDHTVGNQAYLEAFPGAEIIAHPATRELAISNGSFEGFVPAFRAEIANVDKQLAAGKIWEKATRPATWSCTCRRSASSLRAIL
jgi:glyoxylase-like metal-dependent hydrolase (beta-lactamase superfamily II)